MSPDETPEARGNPVPGHKKGSPFQDGPLFAKAADLGTFALFRENADFLRALNSHAETFVFFVLGQRDDGRVTSEYAAFHKVPSRGALQSFVGDFTPGGGKVLSADIDALTAVETSSNPPEEAMGSSPHERQEAIHVVERQLPKRLKLFRGEDGWFARGRQGQVWEYGTGKLGFTVKRPRMVAKAIKAGFVATQRGDQEANFSCPWTQETIERLIRPLRLRTRGVGNPSPKPMPEHRNGKISGESERIESLAPDRGRRRTGGGTMIATTGVGPPGPQNDSAPGGETGGGTKSVNGGEPIGQSLPVAARDVNTRIGVAPGGTALVGDMAFQARLCARESRGGKRVRECDYSPLKASLERLSVCDVWQRLGVEGKPGRNGKACRSPFRPDRNPSFSIYMDGRRWKDHATGEGGDAADFCAKARIYRGKRERGC